MSSGFVTETEAAEARKRRQEEWEKVRTAEQPLERPEEPYDGRSLYDRLQEQKMKKDADYEESHKLKNLIRGLDDDEVQFLELVDQNKLDAERRQMQEEEEELNDFRTKKASLEEQGEDKKIQTELRQQKPKSSAAASSQRPTQKSLLGVGIKRKNSDVANNNEEAPEAKSTRTDESNGQPTPANLQSISTSKLDKGHLKCIAILPGIGSYAESTDSEMSSGSDEEPETTSRFDLVGRAIKRKKQSCQDQ